MLICQNGFSDNIQLYSNTVVHCNWGLVVGDGQENATCADVWVHHNIVNDFASWDDPGNNFHRDGIFIWVPFRLMGFKLLGL